MGIFPGQAKQQKTLGRHGLNRKQPICISFRSLVVHGQMSGAREIHLSSIKQRIKIKNERFSSACPCVIEGFKPCTFSGDQTSGPTRISSQLDR